MPMNRKLYPANWDEISREVKDRAGWRCQLCGKDCRPPGEPLDTHRNTLTTAHLDHDPTNHDTARLAALCAPCHLRYDGKTLFGCGDYGEGPSEERLPGIDWSVPFVRINDLAAYSPQP